MRRFSVRWQNFRSLEDTEWIEIRPLTVLIGANNSGKTSFLAPLLLMKQTLMARNSSTALLAKGDLINLGSYQDLVYRHQPEESVELAIRWHVHDRPNQRELKSIGTYPPGIAEFTFRRGIQPTSAVLQDYKISDLYGRTLLKRSRLKSGRYSLRDFASDTKAEGTPHTDAVWKAIREDQPRHFFFTSAPITRVEVERFRHEAEDLETGPQVLSVERDARSALYQAIVDTSRFEIAELLEELFYLGPLRERARRVYELSGEMPADVGTRGEDAPEILYRWRDQHRELKKVHDWLELFGFEGALRPVSQGDYAFAINVRPRGASVSGFVDMGFGMSQVLPLIIQGAKARPGSMIVAEQPEIHLNPSLQASLADLCSEFANSGLAVLVETHSEHLLLRLRRLVAEKRIKAGDVALYYVENKNGRSTLRSVPVSESGHIENFDWPDGFFGDSLKESLALARAQSRLRTH